MWLDTFGIQERKFTRLKSCFCKCRSRVKDNIFSRSKVEFVKYVLRIYFKKFEWVVQITTRQKRMRLQQNISHTHTRICLQAFSFFLPQEASNVEINFFTKRHKYALIQKQHIQTFIVFCYQNQVSEWLRYPKRFFAKFLF